MLNDNNLYDIDEDISRTMYDRFIDALNDHFNNVGSLVISAPKGGGDVFKDAEFTQRMGDFVFDTVICEGEGIDTIRGHIVGELEGVFESVGGLYFEIDLTAQGRARHRFIDAERQIRGFDTWYFDENEDESAIQQMEALWEDAKLK